MATLYNNGQGNQSMGNMGAGMAAAQAAWQKAQLEGDPQAGKKASENFQKAEALKKTTTDPKTGKQRKPTKKDIEKAEKEGQKKSDAEIKRQQNELQKQQKENAKNGGIIPPKPIKNEPDVSLKDLDESLLKEYGNNLFELVTYDPSVNNGKNNGQIRLIGVLKQLPNFSMSTKWSEGPGASITNLVKDYLGNELLEIVTTIGGNDRSWNAIDEQSDRSYDGVASLPTFNLDFRIYTTETIGTKALTSWTTWETALALFAQPSIASKVSVNSMGNNLVNGVLQGLDNVTSIIKSVPEALGSNVDKSSKKNNGAIMTAIDAVTNTVGDVIDKAAVLVTSRDDQNRVEGQANRKSYYGAKLWKLRILPGILQRRIPVYISSWSVTYSKERKIVRDENGNAIPTDPIYVDFNVQCQLDQVPNSGVWMYYFDKNANSVGIWEKYEETGKKAPTKPAGELTKEVRTTTFENKTTKVVQSKKDSNGNQVGSNYEAYVKPDGSREVVQIGDAVEGEEYLAIHKNLYSLPAGYRWVRHWHFGTEDTYTIEQISN